ncbi:MAG: preprotein translocase subunit TatB [Gammaproteobacteria bacterium HGW-Gammaproteobacteria-8]|nr:MAG: preprotein translocase subunit TatB [Gammaproteobacteria bacterium HGW-Gammaproteobacteria-8]
MDPLQHIDRTLDARGLLCPEPVLRVRTELRSMSSGQLLEVLADDPLVELDLRVFCERFGHQLSEAGEFQGAQRFLLRVGPASTGNS